MNDFFRQALNAIVGAFGRLSPREQRLIAVLGVVGTVGLIYVFAIEPAVLGRARLERRIEALSRDLGEMRQLTARIERLESELGKNDSKKRATASDFSLF